MTAKWKLNRAGLFNFWYYDNEIFHFEDGKLLLRGTNGSGKSVTMQSLLPVLLDGKKSPDRLDPFGSRSRHMADYLLGEKEVSDRDERTGYLFIEYKMEGTSQYITTGIGMQAKRNQALKSWGFVITDNRRIGTDLQLYKLVNQNGEKQQFPLSQTELTTTIGGGGEVVSSNLEYMKLVNRYVFGFETIEAYDDLIKLLIQLRSPKLSKDFKPTVIYEILEQALPPLTEDDLRYLSDSIEQMDQTKQQMEQIEREEQALAKLNAAYDAYVERIFADQVKEWKQAEARHLKEERELDELQKKRHQLEVKIDQDKARLRVLNISQETLNEQYKRLESHEVFQLEKEIQQKKLEWNELESNIRVQSKRLDDKKRLEREARDRIHQLENEAYNKKRQLTEMIEDIEYEAQESAFKQHDLNVQDYTRNEGKAFGFENWKKEVEIHHSRLGKIQEELQQRDQLVQQFQNKDQELSVVKRRLDELLIEESKWQQLMNDEKQALAHRIYVWLDEHTYYLVENTVKQQMMRYLDDLFEQYEYDMIKDLFVTYVDNYEEILRQQEAEVNAHIKLVVEEKERLQGEWNFLNKMRDPEPKRHEATLAARKTLDEKGITYKPLYEVVEFRENISEDVQVRLESALTETGLLDALITHKDMTTMHDRVLLSEPKLFTETLSDYLQPDSSQKTIPFDRIEAILQSVEMNGQAPVHYTEDGHYRIGNLQGHALPMKEVRFIGREARKRYRELLLVEIENAMQVCNDQLVALQSKQEELRKQLHQSKQAWLTFPNSKDVRTAYNELMKAKQNIMLEEERIKLIADQLSVLDQELQKCKRILYELCVGISLEQTAAAYKKALSEVRQYETKLNQINLDHERWIRLLEDQHREAERLSTLESEVDEWQGALHILEDKKTKLKLQIQHMEQQQQLKGAEDVRSKIQLVANELAMVNSELDELKGKIPAMSVEVNHVEQDCKNKQHAQDFWLQMKLAWHESVMKEWKRGIVAKDFEDIEGAVANKYMKQTMKEKSNLEGQLTGLFHSLQPDLTEHKMNLYTDTPNLLDWMNEIDQEEWTPIISQWKDKSTRNMIEFDQRGVKISPAALYEDISRELSIQETRIDEMDKQLYEEILLNSVGHKLRARIRRAEHWTEKMKGLMESRDTSSGLKFSIRWKPKTADSEEELDTQELVTLLKQDTSLLNEEDMSRITRHFRSKINSAKLWLEDKGDGQTLLQVLKNVLDYRKWFSFVLFYERPNEKRQELTNHHFFKFSGGEKAMAMYIPLFTACYSRYQEASPSAPYIISLDEAFAGVDDNNINEMFEIVEQLGFNYIMNSQVLWGDYQAVQALSVCELIRPKNADFVSIMRYRWNGQKLSLQLEEEGNKEQVDERETEGSTLLF